MQYLLFWFFCHTLSIFIYHWVSKVQSLFLSRPICSAPRVISINLTMIWAFTPGNLPQPFALSVSLVSRQNNCYWRFVPQGVQIPTFTHLMDPGDHLKWVHGDIFLLILIIERGKEFFWCASTCPTLMHPANSHRAMSHKENPLIGLVSIALLPDHGARPLAAAHKSVKT